MRETGKKEVKKKSWVKPKLAVLSIKETYSGISPGPQEDIFTYSIS